MNQSSKEKFGKQTHKNFISFDYCVCVGYTSHLWMLFISKIIINNININGKLFFIQKTFRLLSYINDKKEYISKLLYKHRQTHTLYIYVRFFLKKHKTTTNIYSSFFFYKNSGRYSIRIYFLRRNGSCKYGVFGLVFFGFLLHISFVISFPERNPVVVASWIENIEYLNHWMNEWTNGLYNNESFVFFFEEKRCCCWQ